MIAAFIHSVASPNYRGNVMACFSINISGECSAFATVLPWTSVAAIYPLVWFKIKPEVAHVVFVFLLYTLFTSFIFLVDRESSEGHVRSKGTIFK